MKSLEPTPKDVAPPMLKYHLHPSQKLLHTKVDLLTTPLNTFQPVLDMDLKPSAPNRFQPQVDQAPPPQSLTDQELLHHLTHHPALSIPHQEPPLTQPPLTQAEKLPAPKTELSTTQVEDQPHIKTSLEPMAELLS